MYKEDLTGQKFNYFTVIKKGNKKPNSRAVCWLCICKCGTEKEIDTSRLVSGKVKSCGCLLHKKSVNSKAYGEICGSYWSRIKRDAKYRKIKFDITIQQGWELFLKQNRKCALSGLDLILFKCKHKNAKDRYTNGNASLDRIDSTKDYTIDNVQWVEKRINFMKNSYSMKEFVQMCNLIVKNNKLLLDE